MNSVCGNGKSYHVNRDDLSVRSPHENQEELNNRLSSGQDIVNTLNRF